MLELRSASVVEMDLGEMQAIIGGTDDAGAEFARVVGYALGVVCYAILRPPTSSFGWSAWKAS
jgi:hypothetical protein